MRDIKFRGKRVDNGEWVYGDKFTIGDKVYIIYNPEIRVFEWRPQESGCQRGIQGFVEVIPESVGQLMGSCETGEVYTGDIMTCKFGGGGIKTGYIEYFETHMSFVLADKFGRNIGRTRNMWSVEDSIKELPEGGIKGKVIGNTMDNPELLESETE